MVDNPVGEACINAVEEMFEDLTSNEYLDSWVRCPGTDTYDLFLSEDRGTVQVTVHTGNKVIRITDKETDNG